MEVIPACFGRAFPLSAGQSIEIVTVQGSQVADTWAFNRHDLFEHLAMDQTRSVNSTIQIRRGMALVSSRRTPCWNWRRIRLPASTIPCSAHAMRQSTASLGYTPDHRNCEQNLHEALTALGLSIPFTPAPFNLFMNVPVGPDGTLDRAPPLARPAMCPVCVQDRSYRRLLRMPAGRDTDQRSGAPAERARRARARVTRDPSPGGATNLPV